MTGIRIEEARALRWDHVNLDAASIAVWRSVRLGGAPRSPGPGGPSVREHNLVFTTAVAAELDAANVRRSFRSICEAAGIGEAWAPRKLRTSFVSLLSADGVPVEEIARLAGHSSSRTTEVIYRQELRPVLVKGAEVMDQISGSPGCQWQVSSATGFPS
jgi:integrase